MYSLSFQNPISRIVFAKPLPFESLVVLSTLRDGRRQSIEGLARAQQRPTDDSRSVVEQLVERGLVEAQGRGSSRTYLLAASVYRREGKEAEYVRQAGMTRIEQEQMVLKLAVVKGRIKRKDVMDLCHVEWKPAYAILQSLVAQGQLVRQGTRSAAFYELPGDKNGTSLGTRTGQEQEHRTGLKFLHNFCTTLHNSCKTERVNNAQFSILQ